MNDNSRLAKNTVLLYIRMFASMAISLYTSRVILKNLGIVDFGLYSVVCGVSVMFSFLGSAMNSSVQRYLTIAIGRGDDEYLHKVFNVSCVIHILLGFVVVLLCEIVGIWFIYNKMVIPDGREVAVLWAFHLSLVATFINMISIPYNAIIIARERMGAFAFISIFDVLFKLFIAYIISVIAFDRLIVYSILLTVSPILQRVLYIVYCKRNFKETSFELFKFDGLYKEITVFASWGLLGHFSWVINSSIQNMMLNVYFSPVVNAARAITTTVSNRVNEFNNSFQMAVSPQVTKSWARGDVDRTFSLIYNSSRFSLYLMWIITLPLIICVEDALNVWLVEVPPNAPMFLRIALIDGLICSIANPLNMAIRARGEIKYPEIVGGIILILNLPLSFIFLECGAAPYVVFIIMVFCDILAQGSRVFFANRYLNMPVLGYMKKVVIEPLCVMIVSAVGPLALALLIHFDNRIINLLIFGSISVFSVFVFVYSIGINSQERVLVKDLIKNRLKLW